MLLWLTEVLSQYFSALTVFQYLTLRGILGTLTALLISLIIGPVMIRKLSQYQIGQAVRDDGPQTHLSKAGTPTMGGALILVAIGISTLLWADLGNRYVWVTLLVTLLFGAIGWVDDYQGGGAQSERSAGSLEILLAVGHWCHGGRGSVLQLGVAAGDLSVRAVRQTGVPHSWSGIVHPAELLRHCRQQQRGQPH